MAEKVGNGVPSLECSICLEGLHELSSTSKEDPVGTRLRCERSAWKDISPIEVVATPCGHLYHRLCLEKWVAVKWSRECPTCKSKFQKKSLLKIFLNTSPDSVDESSEALRKENLDLKEKNAGLESIIEVKNRKISDLEDVVSGQNQDISDLKLLVDDYIIREASGQFV